MSDAARQNLKISREGIVLIKSFEGFRPRAIQREHGGWIIGYGHTLSAREGATVSEADAELLLRYDLLPVEKSVNEVPADLNQHQFDALVSFAFSVGVDDFAASDVRQRLNAGAAGEAADAMMGWPEPTLPETALRRRAAERALFVANPGAPVALSDLLSAPLPPPAVVSVVETPVFQTPAVEPEVAEPEVVEPEVVEAVPAEDAPVASLETTPEPVDPRGAAVAALLGEPAARLVPDDQPEPVETEAAALPADDAPAADPVVEAVAEPEPAAAPVEDIVPVASNDTAEIALAETPATDQQPASIPDAEPGVAVEAEPEAPIEPVAPTTTPASLSAARYSPYGAIMVGRLPYLDAAPEPFASQPETPAIAPVAAEISAPEPTDVPVTASQTAEVEAPAPAPAMPPLTIASTPVVVLPAGPFVVDPAPVAELVLTPLDEAPEPAFERPLWTADERDAPDGSEANLFGEDLTLTAGGSILRNDIEFEPPARFDWSETGPFIFMGGVGLVSFGASMAAFRRAAEQSGGGELTIIGWVLALIGLACVGVSSVNLYRKFGLPGGD